MDEEDSSDDEGFVPVVGKKRKKLDGAGADGEKLQENLLQNNKFGPLAGNNNNAGQAGAGGAPAVPAPSKPASIQRQPPIVITSMSITFTRLTEVLTFYKVRPEIKFTRSGTKLTCFSPEEFEKVKDILLEGKIQFYSHGKRCERSHRIVLRGMPEMEEEELKSILKEGYNLEVLDVKAIKRKGEPTTAETPYIVSFPKGHTNLKKLSDVDRMGPMVIRWEAYRNKQPYVTQCRNCLRHGHGAKNCHIKGRCNNCGKSHKTDQCKAEATQAKRCANCSGAHEAMDRSCPKRAEFIRARQQSTKQKPSTKKAEKRPPVPALNPENFPPLPGVVPGGQNPQPEGSTGGTGPGAGGTKKKKNPQPGGRQDSAGSRADATTKADEEEELYSAEELWKLFLEFSAMLKKCRTRSDQERVVAAMAYRFNAK